MCTYNSGKKTCNSNGVSQNCSAFECGQCNHEYDGLGCDNCARGFYPTEGENGIVDEVTGNGVKCSGMLIIIYKHFDS